MKLELAQQLAGELVDLFGQYCERIHVAGSVRRRAGEVGDIELVAEPKFETDMFGDVDYLRATELERALDRWPAFQPRLRNDGARIAWGERYMAITWIRHKTPIDLFLVRPPAQWGCIFAIRTGPAAFAKRMVMEAARKGLRCDQGRLVDSRGVAAPTPEEDDFFRALRMEWIEPEDRR